MLPSVVDDPARALNSETWEDLGREFLWSHARFGIVDHAVRKNARANNGPLAGYLARDSLYIWALCPVDHGPPHGDPSQIGPGRGGSRPSGEPYCRFVLRLTSSRLPRIDSTGE